MMSKPLTWTFVIWWVIGTFAGLVVSFLIVLPFVIIADPGSFGLRYYLLTAAAFALVGALIALGQYMVLKRHLSVSRWWIATGAAALSIAMAAGEMLPISDPISLAVIPLIAGGAQSILLRSQLSRAWLWLPINLVAFALVAVLLPQIGALAAWLSYAVVTGLGMFWLLKQK